VSVLGRSTAVTANPTSVVDPTTGVDVADEADGSHLTARAYVDAARPSNDRRTTCHNASNATSGAARHVTPCASIRGSGSPT
jgi:hypothetical protein